MSEMQERNAQLIDRRIEEGLALLGAEFAVTECEVDPLLASPVIGGRPHHARRFHIEGLGNLLAMTVRDAPENQLSSLVITPYCKDLPLFSTDFVYSGERRFFLMELYDLCIDHGGSCQSCIDVLSGFGREWDDMPDFPTRPCWYDDIRPVCIAKAPSQDQDELALTRSIEALGAYVSLAKSSPSLDVAGLESKWLLNKGYSDRLVDEGGVSTDLFTQAIGPEATRRFFDEVFFGPACYRP